MRKAVLILLAIAMMTSVLSAEWTQDEYYNYFYACRSKDMDNAHLERVCKCIVYALTLVFPERDTLKGIPYEAGEWIRGECVYIVHKQVRDFGLSDHGWDDELFPEGVPYIYDRGKGGVVNADGELIDTISYYQKTRGSAEESTEGSAEESTEGSAEESTEGSAEDTQQGE